MSEQPGLSCPRCGTTRHQVTDTRQHAGTVRRRRKCRGCSSSFHTREFAERGPTVMMRIERLLAPEGRAT